MSPGHSSGVFKSLPLYDQLAARLVCKQWKKLIEENLTNSARELILFSNRIRWFGITTTSRPTWTTRSLWTGKSRRPDSLGNFSETSNDFTLHFVSVVSIQKVSKENFLTFWFFDSFFRFGASGAVRCVLNQFASSLSNHIGIRIAEFEDTLLRC